MRRIIIVTLGVALLTTTAWVVRGAAAGSTAESTRSAAATAVATLSAQAGQRKALYQSQLEQNLRHRHPAAHQHPAAATTSDGRHPAARLANQLVAARLA